MKKYKMTAHDQFMQYFSESVESNEKDKPGVFTDRKTKKSVKWLRTPTIITQTNKGEEGRTQKTSLVLLSDMNSPGLDLIKPNYSQLLWSAQASDVDFAHPLDLIDINYYKCLGLNYVNSSYHLD